MEKYIGIPFLDGGRTATGSDCWGIIMLMYKEIFRIHLPEFPISAMDTDKIHEAMDKSISQGHWVEAESPYKFGDVIVMALCPSALTAINHVGFYIGQGRFIHSIQGQHSASCRLDDLYWKKRIKGAYKWLG